LLKRQIADLKAELRQEVFELLVQSPPPYGRFKPVRTVAEVSRILYADQVGELGGLYDGKALWPIALGAALCWPGHSLSSAAFTVRVAKKNAI